MKVKEVLPTLEGLGWLCAKDEAGDYFCIMNVNGVQVQVIPSIGKRSDHFRVSLMPSVSTKEFTAAAAFIMGEAGDHEPIIVRNGVPEKIVHLSLDDIVRLSQDAISWASAQDIRKGLADYRSLQTEAKGAMPLRHLAALAIAGDAERLKSYKMSFEQGNRLGFVPYIDQDMIERALFIAQDVR